MSRPFVLVFVLVLVAFPFQFEGKQQIVIEAEESPSVPQMHWQSRREESVKEKIILSQEKSIQKLIDLVRSLRGQLLHCKHKLKTVNNTAVPSTELPSELEHQQVLDI